MKFGKKFLHIDSLYKNITVFDIFFSCGVAFHAIYLKQYFFSILV